MERKFLSLCLRGARFCAGGLATLALWTLWLGLSVLAVEQLRIASTNELQVPLFVQQALEERLAMSGVRMTFGHTLFDPSGRILAENVRVNLAGFEEPVMTARAIYLRLDPLALVVRRIRVVELRLTDVSLRVPAMLSPSGSADEIISDLDAAFRPLGGELVVEYLNCRFGTMPVSVSGGIRLGATPVRGGALPSVELLAKNYAVLSRGCAAAVDRLAAFERPVLLARLESAEDRGASVRVSVLADGLKLASPVKLQAKGLRLESEFRLFGPASVVTPISLSADQLEVARALPTGGISSPSLVIAHGLRARLDAVLLPWQSAHPGLMARELHMNAADAAVDGVRMEGPVAMARISSPTLSTAVKPDTAGRFEAEVGALLWSQPVTAHAQVDLSDRRADLRFQGGLGPAAVDAIGALVKREISRFVALTRPLSIDGEAHFGPGWIFSRASAKVAATGITARGVVLDEVRGTLSFDGHTFVASDAFARIGDNVARGTFEQALPGHNYRFLLTGRLRPLDITPWIAGKWWPVLFSDFSFPAQPPWADMDLRGCWTDGRQASVFVSVDSASPVVRGAPFDRVRTKLFVRPQFDDCLQFSVTRGVESASGTFARRIDLNTGLLQNIDLDATSTLDLEALAKALGPAASKLTPFAFDRPPWLQIRGHFEGPGAADGPHQVFHIQARSNGALRYRDFPLDDVGFTGDVHDDMIVIDPIAAGFAGGRVSGKVTIWGRNADRRLKVDAAVSEAILGRAIQAVDTYRAQRDHKPPASNNLVREKANVRVNMTASAEGRFEDPYSFHGNGRAEVQGAGLGEIRMLGMLSELLRFTSLRFTSGRAAFALDGPRLIFSDVSVTGANSEITGHGTYAIDRHELDFRARIRPFKESKTFPQQFIDVMLTPLSDVLEVRLTGNIQKPSWAFVNGPTNLLRPLSDMSPGKPSSKEPSRLR